jgi:hypothetical protein
VLTGIDKPLEMLEAFSTARIKDFKHIINDCMDTILLVIAWILLMIAWILLMLAWILLMIAWIQ